jgi:hypothetical protein
VAFDPRFRIRVTVRVLTDGNILHSVGKTPNFLGIPLGLFRILLGFRGNHAAIWWDARGRRSHHDGPVSPYRVDIGMHGWYN